MNDRNTRRAKQGFLKAIFLLAIFFLFGSCKQWVTNPTQPAGRTLTVRAVTNSERPVPGVAITLFGDAQHWQQIGQTQITNQSGTTVFIVDIPSFGQQYSLRALLRDPATGNTIFDRSREVFLQCQDTTLFVYIDNGEGNGNGNDRLGADTTIVKDCTQDWGPITLSLHACPNDSSTGTISITNNCPTASTYTLPASLPRPFRLSLTAGGSGTGTTVTLQPGGTMLVTVTYAAGGEAQDTTIHFTVASTSANGSLNVIVTGSPRSDCNSKPKQIQCNDPALPPDTLDLGAVCQNKIAGPYCTRIENTGTQSLRLDLPAAKPPFTIEIRDSIGGLVPSTPYTLGPGRSVTVCAIMQSSSAGTYSQNLDATLTCTTGTGSTKVPIFIKGVVRFCDTCDCPRKSVVDFTLSDPISVINGDTTITITIFTNDASCPVSISATQPGSWVEWSMKPPGFSDVVQPGASLQKTFEFRPRSSSGMHSAQLPLTVSVNGKACSAELDLHGPACRDICYFMSEPTHVVRGKSGALDTVMLEQDGNIKVQVSYPGHTSQADEECFEFSNPDTACNPIRINVTGVNSPFSVSPSGTITIQPGSTQKVCIDFTAPTIEDVRARGGNTLYFDQISFSQIGSPCANTYKLKADVDTFQHCKIDRKLTVYEQTTTSQQQPLHEVLDCSDNNVYPQVPPTAMNVPSAHDLFLSAPGVLSITQKAGVGRGLFVIPFDNLFDQFCNNSEAIISKYKSQLPSLPYLPVMPISQKDVVAVELGANNYALIYVTVGDQQDANGLNYVHFVIIYPINP